MCLGKVGTEYDTVHNQALRGCGREHDVRIAVFGCIGQVRLPSRCHVQLAGEERLARLRRIVKEDHIINDRLLVSIGQVTLINKPCHKRLGFAESGNADLLTQQIIYGVDTGLSNNAVATSGVVGKYRHYHIQSGLLELTR